MKKWYKIIIDRDSNLRIEDGNRWISFNNSYHPFGLEITTVDGYDFDESNWVGNHFLKSRRRLIIYSYQVSILIKYVCKSRTRPYIQKFQSSDIRKIGRYESIHSKDDSQDLIKMYFRRNILTIWIEASKSANLIQYNNWNNTIYVLHQLQHQYFNHRMG